LTSPQAIRSWFQKYVNAPRYKSRENLRFTTADGVKLHAVRLAGPAGCGATVVMAHGFANWHRHPKIHEFANQLTQYANVIVLDMRGHGFSEGTSTLGALEYLDVAAAVQQVPDSDALILLGTSMGSAASVIYAGRAAHGDGGRAADAVIAISGPAWWGGRDAARGVGRVLELAASPFMRASLKYLMRVRIAGMREDGRIDPVSVVGEIAPAPLVIIHDKADWYFGADQAEAMQSAAGSTSQLWWRQGGHATDLFTDELCGQLAREVIAPAVAAHRALQDHGRAVVEVADAEVRVEADPSVVVDG
jgi:pimeloyl-ACP methyl ester carboxylesterase